VDISSIRAELLRPGTRPGAALADLWSRWKRDHAAQSS
jgi:hypothetical protein